VKQADHGPSDQGQAEPEAPALARGVVLPLGDDRDRAEEQGNGHEDPPGPEQDRRGFVDRVPERSGEVEEDPECCDHAANRQSDRQCVGGVPAELSGDVVADAREPRRLGPGRGPLSGRRLAGARLTR
jgi:hypothetical protein